MTFSLSVSKLYFYMNFYNRMSPIEQWEKLRNGRLTVLLREKYNIVLRSKKVRAGFLYDWQKFLLYLMSVIEQFWCKNAHIAVRVRYTECPLSRRYFLMWAHIFLQRNFKVSAVEGYPLFRGVRCWEVSVDSVFVSVCVYTRKKRKRQTNGR